ncbi:MULTISPECIES: AraC family transcriptional regulator [Glycomyces]|uniref:AraC-like DNA-binding protein n=1 Tax=Glycomyces lechevalierae TaxID=256034 RepID=A0ABU2ATH2_9ACTN|nr:AraC family transcriptional regulator [Glycomyces lechevalierae]MDR7340496.1 AraC-like DNA-binding protein [Glycomyces lechevalierae]
MRDLLSELMDGVRARAVSVEVRDVDGGGAVFDWAAPLALLASASGDVVVGVGDSRTRLAAGDVMLLNGGAGTGASIGRVVLTADAPTQVLAGALTADGGVSSRLLRALPARAVLVGHDCPYPFTPVIADELKRSGQGSGTILDRITDLVFATTVRAWFELHPDQAPVWHRGSGDPVVDRALALIHGAPQRHWNGEALARESGVSRSALARRFRSAVGQGPMGYLVGVRIDLAEELLRGTDLTLNAIAARVGFSDGFALSAAFKRARGRAPSAIRA